MEKVFFVKNGDLADVNNMLSNGWSVKIIEVCEQNIALTGTSYNKELTASLAYIVLRKD